MDEVNAFELASMTWALLKADEALPRPIPLFGHAAIPIHSAISHKLFTFGGRKSSFEYASTVFCMDANNLMWFNPVVNTSRVDAVEASEGVEARGIPIDGRENCASVFDSKALAFSTLGVGSTLA